MLCPKCAVKLDPTQVQDVALSECPRCKGIWFEKSQLGDAVEEIDPDLRWMDVDFWRQEHPFKARHAGYKCPRGHPKDMAALYFEKPRLKISVCPVCEGLWISRLDFLEIVRALAAEADSKSASDYAKVSLKEALDIIAHPTQLISEWRDLRTVLRLLEYRFFVENPKIRNVLAGIQKSLPL